MDIKVGDVVTSARGHNAVVVEYTNRTKVKIEYPSGHQEVHQAAALSLGHFKDRGKPTFLGVGILGYDHINSREQYYVKWSGMLCRVYSTTPSIRGGYYRKCSVADEWFYLPTFKKWFGEQVFEKGYHLDKDLLKKGNSVYCSDYCVFIPQEINKFLSSRYRLRGEWPVGVNYHKGARKWAACISIRGTMTHLGVFSSPEDAFKVYKNAKEAEAKRLAELWKDKIDYKAFEALSRFEVHIED